MDALPIEMQRHLDAAIGWVDIGNHGEAWKELEQIGHPHCNHPAVLVIRCGLHQKELNFGLALSIADQAKIVIPGDPFGWIAKAAAFKQLNRVEDAYKALRPAADKFPNDYRVTYDLACYSYRLGRPKEFAHWLCKTMRLAQESKQQDEVSKKFMADPDLMQMFDKRELN